MSTERNSSLVPMGKPEVLGPGLTVMPLHVQDKKISSVLLTFDNASDPVDPRMACQLQEGCVGIYEKVGVEGHVTITVYTDKGLPTEHVLEEGVPLPLISGDTFSLAGTGEVKVTNVPPFDNKTYNYIPKPTSSH